MVWIVRRVNKKERVFTTVISFCAAAWRREELRAALSVTGRLALVRLQTRARAGFAEARRHAN